MKTKKNSLTLGLMLSTTLALSVSCEQQSKNDSGVRSGLAQVSLNMQGTKPGALAASSVQRLALSSDASQREARSAQSNPIINVKDLTGNNVGTLTISYAKVVVEEVELKRTAGAQNEGEIDFAGPYIIDLVSNSVTPSFDNINLPSGTYEEIWLGFNRLTEQQATSLNMSSTDKLVGKTFLLEGTYSGPSSAGAQTNIPFTLSLTADSGVDLSGGDTNKVGMNLVTSRVNSVIVAYRMNKWFDFSITENNSENSEPSGLVLTNGEVVLNNSSTGANRAIFDFLVANILESADYGVDADGNGELESDEDDDDDSLDAKDN